MQQTNYFKYRGKCKEYCEELLKENPKLKLIRGWYYCPIWGSKEQHWWLKDKSGNIIDPTKLQFPSAGSGEYIEFDGWTECAECGKRTHESELVMQGYYPCCSTICAMRLVGL